METTPRTALIEDRKNRAIEALSTQFSKNVLPLEEYERLVEYINRAESERELAIIEKIVDETALYAEPSSRRYRDDVDDIDDEPYRRAPFRGNEKISFAIMSTVTTPGYRLREKDYTFVNFMGSNLIDIQEGDLPPGKTHIDAVAIMGETRITVPPDVAVTIEVVPIMGEAKIGRGVETQRQPGMPELVISGCALMGTVVVKLRKESGRNADRGRRRD
jgi:hypothetical protein